MTIVDDDDDNSHGDDDGNVSYSEDNSFMRLVMNNISMQMMNIRVNSLTEVWLSVTTDNEKQIIDKRYIPLDITT